MLTRFTSIALALSLASGVASAQQIRRIGARNNNVMHKSPDGGTQGTQGTTTPIDGLAIEPEDLIIWQACASECSDTLPPEPGNPLCMSYGLQNEGGWERLMTGRLFNYYRLGYRKFVLHLPFGNEYDTDPTTAQRDDGPMPWDALTDAIEHGQGHIIESWERAMEWAESNMPDADFIIYIGSAKDVDLMALWDQNTANADYKHAKLLFQNVAPLLNFKNITLAFDHSASYSPDEPWFHLVRFFASYYERRGNVAFMESYPVQAHSSAWAGRHLLPDAITLEWQHNMRQRLRPNEIDFVRHTGGRVIRAISGSFHEEPDKVAWLVDVVSEGDIPTFGIKRGGPLDGLTALEVAQLITARINGDSASDDRAGESTASSDDDTGSGESSSGRTYTRGSK